MQILKENDIAFYVKDVDTKSKTYFLYFCLLWLNKKKKFLKYSKFLYKKI